VLGVKACLGTKKKGDRKPYCGSSSSQSAVGFYLTKMLVCVAAFHSVSGKEFPGLLFIPLRYCFATFYVTDMVMLLASQSMNTGNFKQSIWLHA